MHCFVYLSCMRLSTVVHCTLYYITPHSTIFLQYTFILNPPPRTLNDPSPQRATPHRDIAKLTLFYPTVWAKNHYKTGEKTQILPNRPAFAHPHGPHGECLTHNITHGTSLLDAGDSLHMWPPHLWKPMISVDGCSLRCADGKPCCQPRSWHKPP